MSAYEPPGYRTAPMPPLFNSPGMLPSFMLPSYTATLVPTATAENGARDWPAFTETVAADAADAGWTAAAVTPAAATATALARPSQRARRVRGNTRMTPPGWYGIYRCGSTDRCGGY